MEAPTFDAQGYPTDETLDAIPKWSFANVWIGFTEGGGEGVKTLKEQVVEELFNEMKRGVMRYKSYKSLHEAYAVIKEELDELWEEIKKKPNQQSDEAILRESLHVAATALRLVLERRGGDGAF